MDAERTAERAIRWNSRRRRTPGKRNSKNSNEIGTDIIVAARFNPSYVHSRSAREIGIVIGPKKRVHMKFVRSEAITVQINVIPMENHESEHRERTESIIRIARRPRNGTWKRKRIYEIVPDIRRKNGKIYEEKTIYW
jgi:hypothetical protein